MTVDINIVDVFEGLVNKVQDKLLPALQIAQPSIVNINFQAAHFLEILNRMTQWQASPTMEPKNYPLVALLLDTPEDIVTNLAPGLQSQETLRIIIANRTQQNYSREDRDSKNFQPILQPIYEALMQQIDWCPDFMTYGVKSIPHRKINRYFWGKENLQKSGNTANAGNDYIDAIEIQNLKLNVYEKHCN